MFAVERHTGKELWVTNVAKNAGADAAYPAAFGGVFVVASSRWGASSETTPWGNTRIFGLAVGTGEKIWEYESETVLMDLTPLFPGDDSFVFMSQDGSVYRVPAVCISLNVADAFATQLLGGSPPSHFCAQPH